MGNRIEKLGNLALTIGGTTLINIYIFGMVTYYKSGVCSPDALCPLAFALGMALFFGVIFAFCGIAGDKQNEKNKGN
jgi:hypothetical protein